MKTWIFHRDGIEIAIEAESYTLACILLVDQLGWSNYD